MITFYRQKFDIPEETALSWLEGLRPNIAKSFAKHMGLELPEGFGSEDDDETMPVVEYIAALNNIVKKIERITGIRPRWPKHQCTLKIEDFE